MTMETILLAIGLCFMLAACVSVNDEVTERQITDDETTNFALDNNDNFTTDGKWLVHDTRTAGLDVCRSIGKVNVETGEVVVIYSAPEPTTDGPGIGAVSCFPNSDTAIFIHGPMTSTGLKYDMACRTGAMIPVDGTMKITWADGRDATAPFTPGALRGGSHRHDPGGPDGKWIGYTYNDAIMKAKGAEHDLRTLGVTHLGIPVSVDDAPGNRSGTGFSVVIVNVKLLTELDANPGTDDIYQASNDRWIGDRGYQKADGSWQIARAFLGKMRVEETDGTIRDHNEVFVVDIPDDITKPGDGPLEGTADTMPTPPAGTVQRRLTHTPFGCNSDVRACAHGSTLAFTSMPEKGKRPQLYTCSPLDGTTLKKITDFPKAVRGTPRWLPDGKHVVVYTQQRLAVVEIATGKSCWITPERPDVGSPNGWCVSPDGKLVAYNRRIGTREKNTKQAFTAKVILPS